MHYNKTWADEYLGDGVYASYDGHHLWLDLRAQDLTTRIALEPKVLDALLRYSCRVQHIVTMRIIQGIIREARQEGDIP